MFNFFKKKKVSNNNYTFHQVYVKKKKNANIYVGQFLSIEVDYDSNDNYYFSSYLDGIVTNKIQNEHVSYCEKYDYGIVKSINGDIVEIFIICNNGFLQRYKIKLNKSFDNGNAFIIRNGSIYDNEIVVGTICDNRYDPSINIVLNSLENDKLVVFLEK